MSITFWAPTAPTEIIRPFADEPDYTEERSTLPELNISDDNARAFIALLGLEFDHGGEILPQDFDPLVARCLVLSNRSEARAPALREDKATYSAMRAVEGNLVQLERCLRSYDVGLSDEKVQRYAQTLLKLFASCRPQGYSVVWG